MKYRLLFLLITTGLFQLSAQDQFSLEQAVGYGLTHHNNMKMNDLDYLSSEQTIREFKSTGMPKVKGGIDYSYYLAVPAQPVEDFISPSVYGVLFQENVIPERELAAPETFEFSFVQPNVLTANIGASIQLFDGTFIYGLKAAKLYKGLIKKDMILAARMLTSAAADARMAGVKLPAMSSAGSGNHGLTAVLPIKAVEDYVECDQETLLRAVGLSHIITAYVKAHTGRLSAVCGCSIAAGAGAAAGVAYLLAGDIQHIAGAIKNLTEDLAGVICDGAKGGCALKLATAAGTAVQSALFSLQGVNVMATDGIIGASPEKTMQNIGTLSTQGMIETDRTILKIMIEKQFSEY